MMVHFVRPCKHLYVDPSHKLLFAAVVLLRDHAGVSEVPSATGTMTAGSACSVGRSTLSDSFSL